MLSCDFSAFFFSILTVSSIFLVFFFLTGEIYLGGGRGKIGTRVALTLLFLSFLFKSNFFFHLASLTVLLGLSIERNFISFNRISPLNPTLAFGSNGAFRNSSLVLWKDENSAPSASSFYDKIISSSWSGAPSFEGALIRACLSGILYCWPSTLYLIFPDDLSL